MQEDELNRLLDGAKITAPAPSPALLDRILADGLDAQQRLRPAQALRPEPGFWARIYGAFGGLPTVAGLCSATVVGLAVGYTDPTTIDYLTGGLPTDLSEAIDLFPSTDFLATEG